MTEDKLSVPSLPSLYQEVIHKTRYARWNETEQRREHWHETVQRYFDWFTVYLAEHKGYKVPAEERAALEHAVLNLDIMPSMRAFMTAGKALDHVAMSNYNCTYTPIDDAYVFAEIMYILMTGSGVGFSVERRYVEKLPPVPQISPLVKKHIVVEDSREGWSFALYGLLSALYEGATPDWDLSLVRPQGARLKTFGGYSSGPAPLGQLFSHIVRVFQKAQGRKLKPIEVFSIATKIAEVVVVGGVRRSATIALFDRDDKEMLNAKNHGEMWLQNSDGKWVAGPDAHYAMANISAVFEETPSRAEFDEFWTALRDGGMGEPGIFNRDAFRRNAQAHNRPLYDQRGQLIEWGANPCCEIQLRPRQACNLTGFVIRAHDTLESLRNKVRLATILGTWQASVDHFEFVRSDWRKNIKGEALLGVCPTGFYDHEVLSKDTEETARWLTSLRQTAIQTNALYAPKIGVAISASVTSCKPAGNSGELYDSASGIHPRMGAYYIRRIRQAAHEPLTAFLEANGFPMEVDAQNSSNRVFSFPIAAPVTATFANEITAIQQVEHWMNVKDNWATHTVSCTVYVRPDEWAAVGDFVYKNFHKITGISFLPFADHKYQQAPIEVVDKAVYDDLVAAMPTAIDWNLLRHFEGSDNTAVSQELVCVGGACTI